MPNHVTNQVTFIGTTERVKVLKDMCKEGNREFSFQAYFPMPDKLIGTRSPANIVSEEELQEWKRKLENGELNKWECDSRPITAKESEELIKMYGANNWYDWQTENWGTKWNCYDVIWTGEITVQFNTAWSTPINALLKLSDLFHDIEIYVRYADEDFGTNVGEYFLSKGQLMINEQPAYGKESFALAMDILGDKDYWLYDRLLEVEDELSEFDTYLIELAHEEGNLIEQYPVKVLEKLMELAVADEQYERAGDIKNIMEKKLFC